MKSNITLGESSDGQYTYMTGMLPLRSVITISKARNSHIPSLSRVLNNRGMKTRMVIPTLPTVWSQDQMCRQYGFEKLYSSNDYVGNHDKYLSDEQVFNLAMKLDAESTTPFFSMILTLSMHQPYTSIVDPSFVINDQSITSDLKNYLNACHYTDAQIAKYCKHLKDLGLFNKSLIIIASDHDVRSSNFGSEINNNIPLYVINGSLNNYNGWQGSCNQLDVYTTILDLLGEYNYWCGLGNSLITSSYNNSVSDLTWEVSELLLLSRYFDNYIINE
jgi:lipoteichoic acid synthase